MDFRYNQFNNSGSQDGPLFYSNLTKVLDERRILPEIAIIISIENDNNQNIFQFWNSQQLTQFLMGKARVLRINAVRQQETFNMFNQLFPVANLPALFVFGPGSAGPSFKYEGTVPSVDEFIQRYNELPPYQQIFIPRPQFYQQNFAQQQPAANNTTSNNSTTNNNNTTSNNNNNNNEEQEKKKDDKDNWFPRHRLTPKPSTNNNKKENGNVQKNKEDNISKEILVEMAGPDKKVYEQKFSSFDNTVKIYVWASQQIKESTSNFCLLIEPRGDVLPVSNLLLLKQYFPKLNLKAVVKGKKTYQNEGNGFISKVKSFFKDISIFADPDDDYDNFWRTISNEEIQQQQQNRNNNNNNNQQQNR